MKLRSTPTPDDFHSFLRKSGIATELKVNKDNDGKVLVITVSSDQDGAEMTTLWFPSKQGCESVRKALQRKGDLLNEDNLN